MHLARKPATATASRLRRVLALLALAAVAAYGLWQAQTTAAQARGQALYNGQAALPGRLAGHDQPMPAAALRCGNCHDEGTARAAPGGSTRFGSALNGSTLTTPQVRRGGPATAYDAQALCTLLRTGVDPAQVLIGTTMPRYAATAAQCSDLWAFLRSR